jgi:phosphoribosylformylglycinamidine synthase II
MWRCGDVVMRRSSESDQFMVARFEIATPVLISSPNHQAPKSPNATRLYLHVTTSSRRPMFAATLAIMSAVTVHRIEVHPKPGLGDPKGAAALREAQLLGVANPPTRIDSASVYLLEGELDQQQVAQVADELLADAVTEQAVIGALPPKATALIEVHPLPGVMDPDAESVEQAIRAMLGLGVSVRTGRRFDMHGTNSATARQIAERILANTVIHAVYEQPYHPRQFPHGTKYELKIVTVPITEMDDAALAKLSRQAHLFLSLDEMRAIQDEYRRLGRNPRDIELETIAQTWSEHCVHKTLKATIKYREEIDREAPRIAMGDRPNHELNPDGSFTIHNLLKSTVVAATHELIKDGVDWCLSVFVDNSGVIAFDDKHAVCFKCETHNHPSAIEPYGGAATGIGGCIRDIIGTGLAAKPIAATDVFCVAHEDFSGTLPAGVLHPRRILTQVVAGVRDYGNRMGIPTLNGAVWFDNDYLANPLVFCGCIGVMPRTMIKGQSRRGDRIVVVGGRTGRDGIHGATFSSAELTDTHADEFSHAVQIGNAITEKKMLDAIFAARDHDRGPLFHAITDCGAGGFSSAIGEMASQLGAVVHLDRAPLKYAGLTPTEIWISEAQERMVLAVPHENVAPLQDICNQFEVEMTDLGHFGSESGELILNYGNVEVGRLSMAFLHEGRPELVREAVWRPRRDRPRIAPTSPPPTIHDALLALLAHPNIATKRWIIRQYDHEVQGGTVIKPMVTKQDGTEGPSDAAVITPVLNSHRGLAIANGLATGLRDDPYVMALAAIDECVRNLVCVGADPARIAILDNFCWPSCNDAGQLGALVRAAEGCYDGAKAYRVPFISGKDSLNNQFTTDDGRTIRIPPTLLISGMGIVADVRKCVTMDAKAGGNLLITVGMTGPQMGGSHYEMLFGSREQSRELPVVDLSLGPRITHAVAELISRQLATSAHDCSEGGLLVAAAEMAFAGGVGLHLDLTLLPTLPETDLLAECFSEHPSRYLLQVRRRDLNRIDETLRGLPYAIIGEFNDSQRLTLANGTIDIEISQLQRAWNCTKWAGGS